MSIQRVIGEYAEKVKRETGQEFKMGTELNSGRVILGSVCDELRMDYIDRDMGSE